MNSFADTQKEWRKAANPMSLFEQQARRNMAMFEQAMKMFMPTLYGSQKMDKPSANPMMEYQAEALAATVEGPVRAVKAATWPNRACADHGSTTSMTSR